MDHLMKIVKEFRAAIDTAKEEGEFDEDICFHHFPRGCCGDASDLLAQYLLDNNITSWYVCGTHYPKGGTDEENWERVQSHAWLTTMDPRCTTNYNIIDITGDQFCHDPEYGRFNSSVYIGQMDWFHRLFEFSEGDVHENHGIQYLGMIASPRLYILYNTIIKRIS